MNMKTAFIWRQPKGLLAFIFLVGLSQHGIGQVQRKAVIEEPRGLAIVFDASESTCGYFVPGDSERKLLGLIKRSVSQADPSSNNRTYLLKQQSRTSVDPQRDIAEAPADFQALAEMLADKAEKKGAACAPFNGAGSNLELIFDSRSVLAKSQSMILVTDGQFLEKDREKFVQGFVSWAAATHAKGVVPYSGVALVQSTFSGRYFSITGATAKSRDAGYTLPQHNRPLLIFWFLRDVNHLPRVKDLVGAVSAFPTSPGADGFVQHILPLPALGSAWLETRFAVDGLTLERFVENAPKLEIRKYDASRSSSVVADCVRTSVHSKGIVIEAQSKCADGKPLFDGVSEILARFKLSSFPFHTVRYKGDLGSESPSIAWRLTSKAFGESPFQLEASPKSPNGTRAAYLPYSLDSDHCTPAQLRQVNEPPQGEAGKVTAISTCVDKLEGKAYQLDVLLDQLLNRRVALSQALLSQLGAQTYTFSFKAKK
jgi:hypothetical protein